MNSNSSSACFSNGRKPDAHQVQTGIWKEKPVCGTNFATSRKKQSPFFTCVLPVFFSCIDSMCIVTWLEHGRKFRLARKRGGIETHDMRILSLKRKRVSKDTRSIYCRIPRRMMLIEAHGPGQKPHISSLLPTRLELKISPTLGMLVRATYQIWSFSIFQQATDLRSCSCFLSVFGRKIYDLKILQKLFFQCNELIEIYNIILMDPKHAESVPDPSVWLHLVLILLSVCAHECKPSSLPASEGRLWLGWLTGYCIYSGTALHGSPWSGYLDQSTKFFGLNKDYDGVTQLLVYHAAWRVGAGPRANRALKIQRGFATRRRYVDADAAVYSVDYIYNCGGNSSKPWI
ncbi:hypothetical protein AKJ16_DCAP16601 [Drosera capensis]